MWRVLFFLLAGPAGADVVRPDGTVIECYCRDGAGGRVDIGETICLQVGGRAFMALCRMSVNVPDWKDTGEPCVMGGAPSVATEAHG